MNRAFKWVALAVIGYLCVCAEALYSLPPETREMFLVLAAVGWLLLLLFGMFAMLGSSNG